MENKGLQSLVDCVVKRKKSNCKIIRENKERRNYRSKKNFFELVVSKNHLDTH